MPEDLRLGQIITFNISAAFVNQSSTETFENLLIDVEVDFMGYLLIPDYSKITGNLVTIELEIPYLTESSWMNISIEFLGTSTIQEFSQIFPFAVLPRWESNFTIQDIPDNLRLGQIITFNISSAFNS